MTAHIAIARGQREHEGRTGPKAAFDFYLTQHLPTTRERQAEIRSAGNKKAQFEAYCGLFGSQFGKVNGNGAVRSEHQREEVRENGVEQESVVAKLARLLGVNSADLAKIAQSNEDEVEDEVEDNVIVATRISFPMAMAIKRIASKSGVTFEITDKTGGKGTGTPANYACKLGGRKLTPVKASALIAESKTK